MTTGDDSSMPQGSITIHVVRAPSRLTARLQDELAECWAATANAGGAVGFPSTPVAITDVRDAVRRVASDIDEERTTVIVARDDKGLAGWVALERNEAPLVAHWAMVRRLQAHPRVRNQGIGTRLMNELVAVASDLGLEQLHLAVRGGMGLESFYERLGWRVVGTWPNALRISPDETRDEVMMMLTIS